MDKKQVIHAAVLGGALVVSLSASAATLCSGTAGTGSTVSAGTYVKAQFVPKCSSNTLIDGLDGGEYALKGGSTRGKTIYGGSTAGGAISACSTFATGGFTAVQAASSTGC